MDFKLPEEILADFHKRIDHGIFGYTDPDQEYYDALDRWFAVRHGYHVEPETVTVGCGVVYGLATGVKAFTKAGDSILIQQPVYYPFREVIEDNGRIFVNNQLHYEDGKYTIDFDDFEKKIIDNKVNFSLQISLSRTQNFAQHTAKPMQQPDTAREALWIHRRRIRAHYGRRSTFMVRQRKSIWTCNCTV